MNALRRSIPLSLFLVGRPSFLEGFGQVFDFANSMSAYNISRTPELADFYAAKVDCLALRDDFVRALKGAGFEVSEALTSGRTPQQEQEA